MKLGSVEFFRKPGEIDLAAGLAVLLLVIGIGGILNHVGALGITGGEMIRNVSLSIAIAAFGLMLFFTLVSFTEKKTS